MRRGMSFQSVMLLYNKNINKHHCKTAQQRQTKEELKEGKNLHWCNATVIKEIQRRHTNTPAVTDGGSPSKEESATQHCKRREQGRNNFKKAGRIHY